MNNGNSQRNQKTNKKKRKIRNSIKKTSHFPISTWKKLFRKFDLFIPFSQPCFSPILQANPAGERISRGRGTEFNFHERIMKIIKLKNSTEKS